MQKVKERSPSSSARAMWGAEVCLGPAHLEYWKVATTLHQNALRPPRWNYSRPEGVVHAAVSRILMPPYWKPCKLTAYHCVQQFGCCGENVFLCTFVSKINHVGKVMLVVCLHEMCIFKKSLALSLLDTVCGVIKIYIIIHYHLQISIHNGCKF